MGFYTNGDGDRGGTNVHFNKPYLIRKWLPHYDWVLWLDMDTLVVDMARPIEKFIEEIGGQVCTQGMCNLFLSGRPFHSCVYSCPFLFCQGQIDRSKPCFVDNTSSLTGSQHKVDGKSATK